MTPWIVNKNNNTPTSDSYLQDNLLPDVTFFQRVLIQRLSLVVETRVFLHKKDEPLWNVFLCSIRHCFCECVAHVWRHYVLCQSQLTALCERCLFCSQIHLSVFTDNDFDNDFDNDLKLPPVSIDNDFFSRYSYSYRSQCEWPLKEEKEERRAEKAACWLHLKWCIHLLGCDLYFVLFYWSTKWEVASVYKTVQWSHNYLRVSF